MKTNVRKNNVSVKKITANMRKNSVQMSDTDTLQDGMVHIHFDKNTPQVNEALLNPYGLDLTDLNAIGYIYDKLKFTVMGFRVIKQFDTLIATVEVSLHPHGFDEYTYIQKIDMFNEDRLTGFARSACYQLNLDNQEEIKKGLYSLRSKIKKYKLDKLKEGQTIPAPRLLPGEKKEALSILSADNLMECVEGLLEQAGVVTEKQNALRLFLILLTRHFDKPLHALLQGSPVLSKMLLDTITRSLPNEQKHEQTSMSNSSLYYTIQKDYWKNKVLYANNLDKHFKGVHTLKEFIDNLKLKRQTTEADYLTRQLYSSNKEVNGPICLIGYTEDEGLYQKLLQQCFFIRVEESASNRKDMINHQKREFAGLINQQEQEAALKTLISIQRLIEPINVIVPFALELELPTSVFQPLRSYTQLLTFVKAVALLHQHQLKKKTNNGEKYIEATHEHLEIAIELMKEIMIRKSDVLTQAQRHFFEHLKLQVKNPEESFTPGQMMKALKMKNSYFYRLFNMLKDQGLVEKCGGDKKKAEQYQIVDWNDYTELEKGMNVLDEQLKQIREQFPL